MVAVTLSQYSLQVISTMMVGHLGELSLSSTAIAVSLCGVTGFSFLLGMASALETLCGQAYGAKQYGKLGIQTYTAIFSLILVCIPVSLLWIYMGKLLIFMGQDPLISREAGKFAMWLVPALFAYAVLQPLVRYFQTQSLVIPMLISSFATLCFHIPLSWVLVFNSGLNNLGAALAMSISIWLNVIFLALYMKYSSACAKTLVPISMEMFQGIGEFFRFAIPSAVMICLEWWSFELLILLSGLLPHPQLETSVLSVCLSTISTLYAIPFGVGAAASTRVSNELGAGNPQAARVAVCAAMILAVLETLTVSMTLFACRHVFGYSFSNEKEVVDYVTVLAPLVCLSIIMDSIQGVLSGIARGCGWQHIGAYVNLGAFYLFGIPMAVLLGFWIQLRGKGLWIGILCGATLQSILLSIITSSSLSPKTKQFLDQARERAREMGTWEVKRLGYIAGPMVAVTLSQFSLQVISVMMVGHLGELSLSSTAIAISLSGVTGFSLLLGMASGLETLCGQAYGAKQYRKLGIQTHTAIFSLILVCLPLSLIWIYMAKILVFIGQDPLISLEAGKFTMCLVPALFAYAVLQPLVRYFQTQSLIIPMLISSCATLCFHIPLCWVLVFKSGLYNLGAALAISISNWLNVIFLALYITCSSACAKTRVPISMELFQGIGEFFRFAVPSAVMICLEWWSFELLILLSGLLPHPQLETSVLSICLTTITTVYMIPYGLGAAVSTRVSNELGAGNPQAARVAVCAIMFLAVLETLIVSTTLFACRRVFGFSFSDEKEVVDYVTDLAPLVCLSVIIDGIQGVLSGVARGCGWQHVGAYVNLGAFYLFGIPLAALLGFWVQLRGKGLWIGILSGATLQTLLLSIITSCSNWEKLASKARRRIFEGRTTVDDELM
ncbi:hypothetical protein L1049_006470 [Liquidambar formosana]|uniref:Protein DETOXIFICATION n=1 Tax=Liquidambar formosana TaxID=63359 RepID=A0AAP0RH20_LIQFO